MKRLVLKRLMLNCLALSCITPFLVCILAEALKSKVRAYLNVLCSNCVAMCFYSSFSFQDGSKEEYDVIIYCTGYVHNFPFMEDDLKLKTGNRLAVPLYKQVVFPDNPKLFYIGMQNQFYTYPMFWLQGHLCAKIIKGERAACSCLSLICLLVTSVT